MSEKKSAAEEVWRRDPHGGESFRRVVSSCKRREEEERGVNSGAEKGRGVLGGAERMLSEAGRRIWSVRGRLSARWQEGGANAACLNAERTCDVLQDPIDHVSSVQSVC